jgi:hypothetical protein
MPKIPFRLKSLILPKAIATVPTVCSVPDFRCCLASDPGFEPEPRCKLRFWLSTPANSPLEVSAWPSSFALRGPTALGLAFSLLVELALGVAVLRQNLVNVSFVPTTPLEGGGEHLSCGTSVSRFRSNCRRAWGAFQEFGC